MKPDRTPRMIDLTGHLKDLRGSLSPDSRAFDPAPELYGNNVVTRRPAGCIRRLAIAFFLIITLILTAYLTTAR